MKVYTLKACEDFIDKYVNEYKGQVTTLREGCLGLGEVVLHNAEGKKSVVIKEVYLNDWNCGHTVRRYNALPKSIQKELALTTSKMKTQFQVYKTTPDGTETIKAFTELCEAIEYVDSHSTPHNELAIDAWNDNIKVASIII